MPETAKIPVEKVRQLQRKLYVCAKRSRTRRFHALYDRIYRSDVLWEAWRRVRSNGGAAGVDAETIRAIDQRGPGEFLAEIQEALRAGRYRPSPVKRRYIPKADGKQRPLGIPTASANCTGAQIAFRMGGDLPSVPSAPRPALSNLERAPNSRHRYLPTPRSGSRHVQHCARLDRPGRSFSVRLAGFATAAVRC
jgi:hypothetical protein